MRRTLTAQPFVFPISTWTNGLITLMLMLGSSAYAVAPIAPSLVPGKEYSNHIDETAGGVADNEQAIAWNGLGGASDTFDFTPGAPGPIRNPDATNSANTDALAHDNDFLFNDVRGNLVPLVFSTDSDARILTEETNGAAGVWALPGIINAASPPEDVDAIELWGPELDDAFNYSLELPNAVPSPSLPSDPAGIAVWHVPDSIPGTLGSDAYPLLTDAEIATAIASLAPDGLGLELLPLLNLDAMMLNSLEFELGDPGTANTRAGSIIFSIDPVLDPATGALVFDGGEIFTLEFDSRIAAVPAAFLRHGGHEWDTAFDVMGTFGASSENVNGIEAVVPEPSTFALCIVAIAAWAGGLRMRTKHRV